MKHTQKYAFLFLIIAIIITIISADIIVAICFLDHIKWSDILKSITAEIITAVIVTTLLGTLVKMITEKYFIVRKNDKMLRHFGVSSVGTGRSSSKDVTDIFGNSILRIYPREIHLLFITGNIYLSTFRRQLLECIANGTNVKILLIDTGEDNLDFVHRLEKIYNREPNTFVKQIDSIKALVNDIRSSIKKNGYSGTLELRFYRDEYFYNYRSAIYYDAKKEEFIHKSNLCIQPLNKPATDCSIGLTGVYEDTDTTLEENIFHLNDQTFNILWDNYVNTRY